MANYKSRAYIPNPQAENNDTAGQASHPGCPPPPGGTGNGCLGSDWGYFTVGHVLFISYGDCSSRLMGIDTHCSGMPDSKGLDVYLEKV